MFKAVSAVGDSIAAAGSVKAPVYQTFVDAWLTCRRDEVPCFCLDRAIAIWSEACRHTPNRRLHQTAEDARAPLAELLDHPMHNIEHRVDLTRIKSDNFETMSSIGIEVNDDRRVGMRDFTRPQTYLKVTQRRPLEQLSPAMLFFAIGMPGEFAERSDALTVELVRKPSGAAELISGTLLNEIAANVLRGRASDGS